MYLKIRCGHLFCFRNKHESIHTRGKFSLSRSLPLCRYCEVYNYNHSFSIARIQHLHFGSARDDRANPCYNRAPEINTEQNRAKNSKIKTKKKSSTYKRLPGHESTHRQQDVNGSQFYPGDGDGGHGAMAASETGSHVRRASPSSPATWSAAPPLPLRPLPSINASLARRRAYLEQRQPPSHAESRS